MNQFIQLTQRIPGYGEEKPITINLAKVQSFGPPLSPDAKHRARIVFENGDAIIVMETPGEIKQVLANLGVM